MKFLHISISLTNLLEGTLLEESFFIKKIIFFYTDYDGQDLMKN